MKNNLIIIGVTFLVCLLIGGVIFFFVNRSHQAELEVVRAEAQNSLLLQEIQNIKLKQDEFKSDTIQAIRLLGTQLIQIFNYVQDLRENMDIFGIKFNALEVNQNEITETINSISDSLSARDDAFNELYDAFTGLFGDNN